MGIEVKRRDGRATIRGATDDALVIDAPTEMIIP
jgi:hypothetical protein